MQLIVVSFGAAIAVLGMWGALLPGKFVGVVGGVWRPSYGPVMAVVLRLLLGWTLIAGSGEARFPVTFRVLGLVSLIGAIAIPVLGRPRVLAWIDWWTGRSAPVIRIWALAVATFGGFLVYARF